MSKPNITFGSAKPVVQTTTGYTTTNIANPPPQVTSNYYASGVNQIRGK